MYPTDVEVRYVEALPVLGSRVTSSLGDAFVVQAVRRDDEGWVVVAVREDESRHARVQRAEQLGDA
jgi:hypothetical protein